MHRNAINNPETFEHQIKALFRPVDPDPTFVAGLSQRLVKKTPIRIEGIHSLAFLPLMIAAGLFSGALLLWRLNKKNKINQAKEL